MNAKKSKALRRTAKVAAEGLPYRAYATTDPGGVYQYSTDTSTDLPMNYKKNDTVALTACVRAVYQGSKRNVT